MTPHPQRCETCTKTDCLFNPNAEEDWKSFSPASTWEFTSLFGCASHSSAPTEREKVLGILALKLRSKFSIDENEEYWLSYKDFESVISELEEDLIRIPFRCLVVPNLRFSIVLCLPGVIAKSEREIRDELLKEFEDFLQKLPEPLSIYGIEMWNKFFKKIQELRIKQGEP